jgi:WD40 repeat protein
MPDVFISYSRRNGEFVHKLHDALVERGKDVWVDWEDIPPAAEWPKEIDEGIEASDNFLFVISPDSIVSRVCMKELTHAVSQQKRLVPLLYEEVDGGAIPEALASRNWIFVRDGTELAPAALERLLQALETDLEWVGTHTRLLGRALEWERTGRDSSFLLRGRDLDEAERSVASRPTHREPQPTQLQSEYLLASRRAATRRQRVVITAALVGLAVSAGLAVLAWTQRNAAVEEAKVARSRELAAEAVAGLAVDPEQSLVSAAKAATTKGTNEARDALREALSTSRLRSLIDAGAPVNDIDVDSTGRLVAAALDDGRVRTWAIGSGRPLKTFRLARGAALSVALDREGRRLLGTGNAGAAIWSAASPTAKPLVTFDSSERALAGAFSPDGKLVATGDYDGVVRLWRAKTGSLDQALEPPGNPSPITSVAFDADGSKLVAAIGSRAIVWRLGSKKARVVGTHPSPLWAVAFSPDGVHIATGDEDGVVRIWSLEKPGVVELNGHEGVIRGLAFGRDGRTLVSASEDESARIWDTKRHRSLAEFRGHDGLVLGAAFADDGKTVVTGGDDGTIRFWAVAPDPVRAELPAPGRKSLLDIGFDPSGRRLVTASKDGTARIWDLRVARVAHVLRHGRPDDDWVESASFSGDGRLVVTAGIDGTAKVWNASSGVGIRRIPPHGGPPLYDAALSPDGRLLAVAGLDRVIRLWRWREGEMAESLQVRDLRGRQDVYRVDGVAFSADGSLVAGAASDGTVRVWRVRDGTPVSVAYGGGELTSVSFDPAGTLVAAGSTSGAVFVWVTRTGKRTRTLRSHSDTVADVGFSSDGLYLVAAGYDGLADVWTVPDARRVTAVRTAAAELEAAAFARGSREFAVAGTGGRVTVFDCAECRPLSSLVCLAATRVTPRVRAREQGVFGRCD